MFFHICNGFLIFCRIAEKLREIGGGGLYVLHVTCKPRAKYRRMERNNLNTRQRIFMIFTYYDQTVERKPPFDFQLHPIFCYRVMGL